MMICPNCGNPIGGNFCQTCGQTVMPVQTQYQQPVPPMVGQPPMGRDSTVILVIAVMAVVAVVILMVLYVAFFASDVYNGGLLIQTETTPKAGLSFAEGPTGKYALTFDGSVKLDKLEIKVFDDSQDDSIILSPDTETYKEVPGGLNITVEDKNTDGKLNAPDKILIEGGAPGDTITIVYIPTGGTVAQTTLT